MSINPRLQIYRRLWQSIPPRKRIPLKANILMWLQISWVNSLWTLDRIVHARWSQLVFAVGVLCSSFALAFMAIRLGSRMVRHLDLIDKRKREELLESTNATL